MPEFSISRRLLKSVSPNIRGNDYVCSDIHGHFSLLERKLSEVGFNPETDRLFSLEDLIDRGPECDRILEWLNYDWFFAIQGNHERMLVNAYEQKANYLFTQWYAWGGAWAEDLGIEALTEYYEALVDLPVAIELQLANEKKVALVHAELPDMCDWNDVVDELKRVKRKNIETSLLISDMLWKKSQLGRDCEGVGRIESVKNIDHVFHGHTIVDFFTTYANRTFMDLGSYLNDDIGMIRVSDFFSPSGERASLK